MSCTRPLQEHDIFSLRKSDAGAVMRDFNMWQWFIMQDVLLLLVGERVTAFMTP